MNTVLSKNKNVLHNLVKLMDSYYMILVLNMYYLLLHINHLLLIYYIQKDIKKLDFHL